VTAVRRRRKLRASTAVLVYDWRVTGDPHQHFMDVITENGLTVMVEPEV
jgi:hypothetical protein